MDWGRIHAWANPNRGASKIELSNSQSCSLPLSFFIGTMARVSFLIKTIHDDSFSQKIKQDIPSTLFRTKLSQKMDSLHNIHPSIHPSISCYNQHLHPYRPSYTYFTRIFHSDTSNFFLGRSYYYMWKLQCNEFWH